MQEQELILLIRKRDESGIEYLLKHYSPMMRYIIAPILPNAKDQEECISEVATQVWYKISEYDPTHGTWNAWLTALTRNTALNHGSQSKEVDKTEESLSELSPEKAILKQEKKHALNEVLIYSLYRDNLLLYRKYYYLQSTSQIASELGMTEKAVEKRLNRIKNKFQKALEGEKNERS